MRRSPLAWMALGCVLLAFMPRPAAAQFFGQNKVQYRRYHWQSITSDHFDVYYSTGLDSLARRVLDLAEKTNAYLSARMGHQLRRRVPIIVYGSHNDFSQTNVTPEMIDAGTGGFTEVLRNRVVIPFMGSYDDLRHVVVHELTHAFMFDMVYGNSAASLIARGSFFQIPLWFAEGLAEYYSLGADTEEEMVLRDGAIAGYLPPLMYAGGFGVYKEGQSALAYLVARHGEDRLRSIFQRIRSMRTFDRAFQRSLGVSVERFDEQWREEQRRTYWPTVATKQNPEDFARRLTDHRRDESNLNTSPAVSPQGDRVAFFSDRKQYTDVYLMSAIDGKVLRRVIRGERSVRFETVPSFRSAIAWSPDGRELAITPKSGGHDVLTIVSALDGSVRKRIDLHLDAMAYPAWSPVSDSIVVAGLKDGRSDLYLVDVKSGAASRLTDDTWDEKEPAWSPDGRRITFTCDRAAPMVLQPVRRERGFGGYGLYDLDLATREVIPLLDTHGDDHSPAWSPDGRRVAFISDRNGAANIYLYDPADRSVTQLTDVLGGVISLSWSRTNDRLVFSAFNRGGFDIFAVKEPLSLDAVVARLRRQAPQSVLSVERAGSAAPSDSGARAPSRGALAGAWPDTLTAAPDTMRSEPREVEPALTAGGHSDTTRVAGGRRLEPPAWTQGAHPYPGPAPDTVARLPNRTPLFERGGPFALADSVLAQAPTPYKAHLAPDYAGGGFYAASSFGFIGSTQFLLSDFLGDHSLYIATDVFSTSLEETNALVLYNYLPRRWDFSGGFFHFKNYYSSAVTTLGDALGSPRLFSERNFGALVNASYPFDRFRRVEFGFTQLFAEIRFFDLNFGTLVGRKYQSVTSPSVSLVGDNALFGYYGPVNGHRYNLTYSPSLALFDNGLSYHTITADVRHYWDLTHGYTLALRGLGAYSTGRDPRSFFVGGFSTLRGYADYSLEGQRVAIGTVELRFPFIEQLGLVGPVPLGVFNL
ncbi:MAG: PD40 domain-containing protein, partial [Candidatus Eisenbacteria bacterium]|nr:PD40 domain-containing protein [Candidatus Eisenbacteria bacterium]